MQEGAIHEVKFDFDRRRRTGLDETVFAQGKSVEQLDVIFAAAHARETPLFVTRLSAEQYTAAAARWSSLLDYCGVSKTAFFGFVPPRVSPLPAVAIVAAGSSDAGVAREAQRTLQFNGVASASFIDVGVAGLWRLTSRIDEISSFPVVIAVAGMDAALPTVLGGLIPGLIIAVPTSAGYGVAAGGHSALNAILSSCASGVAVVNIDNGYGAACAALRALRIAGVERPHEPRTVARLDPVIHEPS
ncbi:MAG: nickel pincer cofactor biosynthesis protein LarB [Pseudomonadota bacterium]|nr:nickel pincer cofactor biosynthesis protein LarB [Pseudomonadota bacterium]